MKSRHKKVVVFFIKFAFVIAIFYLLFKNIDFQKFRLSLKKARWVWLLVAAGVYSLSLFFHTYKWRVLLAPFTDKIGFFSALKLYYKGLFLNIFLPTSVGGDVVRMYDTYKLTGDKLAGPVSIVMERILGFLSVAFLGIAVWPVVPQISKIKFWYLNFLFFPGVLLSLIFLFYSRTFVAKISRFLLPEFLAIKIEDLFLYFETYLKKKKSLFLAFIILLIIQFLNGATIYCIFKSNPGTDPLNYFLYVGIISLLYIASMLPVSLGGLGVREGAFVLIFSFYSYPKEFLLANSLFYTIILYLSTLPGVIPFLAGYPVSFKEELHLEEKM